MFRKQRVWQLVILVLGIGFVPFAAKANGLGQIAVGQVYCTSVLAAEASANRSVEPDPSQLRHNSVFRDGSASIEEQIGRWIQDRQLPPQRASQFKAYFLQVLRNAENPTGLQCPEIFSDANVIKIGGCADGVCGLREGPGETVLPTDDTGTSGDGKNRNGRKSIFNGGHGAGWGI